MSVIATRRFSARVITLLVAGLLAAAALMFLGGRADAVTSTSSPYPPQPPSSPSCAVSVAGGGLSVLSSGQSGVVTVQGTGFTPGASAEIVLDSGAVKLGSAQASSTGTISQQVTIPAGLLGTHTLGIESATTSCDLSFDPSTGVDAASVTKSSSGLASTGFAAVGASIIAVCLIGGGAMFLVLGRRRRA